MAEKQRMLRDRMIQLRNSPLSQDIPQEQSRQDDEQFFNGGSQ